MISNQETLNLSPYMALYELVVLQDNMLHQINQLDVDIVERSKYDMSLIAKKVFNGEVQKRTKSSVSI